MSHFEPSFKSKYDSERIDDETKKLTRLHWRIQLINLICFLICAVICFLAGFSLYSAYGDELMRRQKKTSEMLFLLMETCMNDVVRFSRQAISSEQLQSALSQIAVTGGEEQAKARTLLQNAITFSIGELPSYVSSVMIRDIVDHDCFYSGLPIYQSLMASINEMIDHTDGSGNPFWHGLSTQNREYLIMTRTVREAKNLNLKPLGCFVVTVDLRAMIRSISTEAQQNIDEMAFWVDDQCLYRGTACLEDPDGTDLIQENWQIISRNGNQYFVTYPCLPDSCIPCPTMARFSLSSKLRNNGHHAGACTRHH